MQLLLLSSARVHGGAFMDFARGALAEFLDGCRTVHFVPFAAVDESSYTAQVGQLFAEFGVRVSGLDGLDRAAAAAVIDSAEVVYIGGGNSFRLLKRLYELDLVGAIGRRVRADGLRYMGSSAGTNMACPSLRTTNDMPIVQPPTFGAIGLIPFQINPHYVAADPSSTFMGETRDQRLVEFLHENDVPVLAMREGAFLRRRGDHLDLQGSSGARLFRRDTTPTELEPGTDISWLLETVPRFDAAGA